jgi:hypothetical protein
LLHRWRVNDVETQRAAFSPVVWLDRAEECRQQAAKAIGPLEKDQWQRLSEEWLKLAQSVERSP